jgi:hypothetical protein
VLRKEHLDVRDQAAIARTHLFDYRRHEIVYVERIPDGLFKLPL